MLTLLITKPDVTCDRRDSVLAPNILIALHVGIEPFPSTKRGRDHGISAIELRTGDRLT